MPRMQAHRGRVEKRVPLGASRPFTMSYAKHQLQSPIMILFMQPLYSSITFSQCAIFYSHLLAQGRKIARTTFFRISNYFSLPDCFWYTELGVVRGRTQDAHSTYVIIQHQFLALTKQPWRTSSLMKNLKTMIKQSMNNLLNYMDLSRSQ